MEKADLDEEISHCEGKLKHIEWEYSNSMTKDWPKLREKELFFIREIARLKKLKNEKKSAASSSIMVNSSIVSAEKIRKIKILVPTKAIKVKLLMKMSNGI
jgi:phosphoenolpyruvate synthase/pyruvate phosphate dikinase